jgi:taurine transport system substrate-binding protein
MANHEKWHHGFSCASRALASLGAAALLIGASAQAQDKPDSINSGIQLVTATDIVAKQRGWAEEMIGVPIEWNTFDSGKDAILGLGAGGVNWSLTGSAPAAFGLSSGVDGEIIWIFHLLGANEALVVQPDSGIESVEDLKGKKVAVPFGTTTHFDMLKAMELADMTQQDLDLAGYVAAGHGGGLRARRHRCRVGVVSGAGAPA